MEKTGVTHSIQSCFGSGLFFGFKNDVTLYHHIVSGRRIYLTNSSLIQFLSDNFNCIYFQYIV